MRCFGPRDFCILLEQTRGNRPRLQMINTHRRQQLIDLMSGSGWDHLLLYGHAWRKDFFRSLINFSFFGPHAAALLSRSGELSVILTHPWDSEVLAHSIDAEVIWNGDFNAALGGISRQNTAIAGLELMEARFADCFPSPISATAAVEKLRRFKTEEEIDIVTQAIRLADLG